jgi:hypothetical protein
VGRAMKVTIRGGIRRSFFFHPLIWQYCGLKKRLVIMISFFQYPLYRVFLHVHYRRREGRAMAINFSIGFV